MRAVRCRSMGIFAFAISIAAASWGSAVYAQTKTTNWQERVQELARQQDWTAALNLIDREIAAAPNDLDLLGWRARLLTWSGDIAGAEQEYRGILRVSRNDPDVWLGLSQVYMREGKVQQAREAIDTAASLDPHRADIHAERGKILRTEGESGAAKSEFRRALQLDPANSEARAGLAALAGEPTQELRFGQENDVLSYTSAIHDEFTALNSTWSSRWATNASGFFYQYYGVQAEKLLARVTRRQPGFAALTAGGAIAHDNGVIPRSEAFFGLDRGWKTSRTGLVRGVEFSYEQHWYWYESARILALNGSSILYLPNDWTFTLGATGARSAFAGDGSEWKPSEMARTEFPVARWGERRLFGDFVFSAGTEDFAQVDQIGRFVAQTYGSGMRFQMTPRQGVSEYVSYQKRTQNRTDIGFGMSYDVHF